MSNLFDLTLRVYTYRMDATQTLESTSLAQQLARLIETLPADAALEVLHFAEYTAVRVRADDAKWDASFANTSDAQWDALIAQWMQGDATGIAVKDDELAPMPLSA